MKHHKQKLSTTSMAMKLVQFCCCSCCSFLPVLLLLLSCLTLFPVSSSAVYHGSNRFWTVDAGGKTYFALHQFQGDTKLIFPNQTTFPEIFTFTTSKQNCDDIGKLNFKFIIDANVNHMRYLRGEVRVDYYLKIFMFQECREQHDGTHYGPINMEMGEKIEVKECFMHGNIPFAQYDDGRSAMDVQVNGTFDCPVFLVLPADMNLEDKTPEAATRLPLNSTFSGHDDGYWWKKENDEMLPKGVTFDAERNPLIDITQMNTSDPLFLRIGQTRIIPTFDFSFNTSCSGSTFDLFLNGNIAPECRISIKLASNGFMIVTKETPFFVAVNSWSSISMVFDAEAVYVKTFDPVSIIRFDICKIVNNPDDQLAIHVSKTAGDGSCDKAELRLLQEDVADGIEVLVDRKRLEPTTTAPSNPPLNESQASIITSTQSVDSASFPWYWIVVGAVLLVVIIIIVCVVIYCFIRRRKANTQKKNSKKCDPPKTTLKPDDGKKNEKSQKKSKSKRRQKKQEKSVEKKKTSNDQKIVKCSKSNDDVMVVKKESQTGEEDVTQRESTRKISPTQDASVEAVQKNYFMYGFDAAASIDTPFDYHRDESSTFSTTLQLNEVNAPGIRVFHNFWDCFKKPKAVVVPRKLNAVYANGKVRYQRVFFFTRDLVADEETYPQFQSLANRMLEPLKHDLTVGESTTNTTIDGEGKVDILRVFITSYEPLTVEVHCRGQCPFSLFKLFECEKCADILKELQSNDWLKSSATCEEDWETFVCRVKRTPVNSHQFLSYNAGARPNTTHDVNHILIIRGNQSSKFLRPCICDSRFSDFSHQNPIITESTQQHTLDNQKTQILTL